MAVVSTGCCGVTCIFWTAVSLRNERRLDRVGCFSYPTVDVVDIGVIRFESLLSLCFVPSAMSRSPYKLMTNCWRPSSELGPARLRRETLGGRRQCHSDAQVS